MKRGVIVQSVFGVAMLSAVAYGLVFCSSGSVPAPESLQATVRPAEGVPEYLEFPYSPPSPTALPAVRKVVLPPPASPFAATPAALGAPRCAFGPWDRSALVIYDTLTCETITLGSGVRGEFNQGSTHFAWIEQTEPYQPGIARVIDLTTRETKELAVAEYVSFNDHDQVLLTASQTVVSAFSVAGSAVVPYTPTPYVPDTPVPASGWSNERGLILRNYRLFVEPIEGESVDARGRSRMVVTDVAGKPVLEFQAWYAVGIEPHHLAVVDAAVGVVDGDWAQGRQDIYMLDLRTGVAEFFANVSADHRIGGNEDLIVLVDRACDVRTSGTTIIIDRATNSARILPVPIIGSVIGNGRVRGIARLSPGYDRLAILFFDPQSLKIDVQFNGWVPLAESPDGRYPSPYIKQGGGFCL